MKKGRRILLYILVSLIMILTSIESISFLLESTDTYYNYIYPLLCTISLFAVSLYMFISSIILKSCIFTKLSTGFFCFLQTCTLFTFIFDISYSTYDTIGNKGIQVLIFIFSIIAIRNIKNIT